MPEASNSALRVLAELADAGMPADGSDRLDVPKRSSEWQWEGLHHLGCFVPADVRWAFENPMVAAPLTWWPNIEPEPVSDSKAGERLAALDALRTREPILRLGWLWLSGVPTSGRWEGRSICFPLLATVVSAKRLLLTGRRVVRAEGDVFANPMIDDRALAAQMVAKPKFGGGALTPSSSPELLVRLTQLTRFAKQAAAALDVSIERWVPSPTDPRYVRREVGVSAVIGVGLYVDSDASQLSRSKALTEWTYSKGVERTAFAAMYRESDRDLSDRAQETPSTLHPTRPLDIEQRDIVVAARSEEVLAIVGPPGTGKTHSLCEVALDAIASGESVLIGASSEQAVQVIARQLQAVGGPVPVLFGGSRTGRELSVQLVDLLTAASGEQRSEAEKRAERAAGAYLSHGSLLARILDAELLAARLQRDPAFRLACEDEHHPVEPHVDRIRAAVEHSGLFGSLARWRAARASGIPSSELNDRLVETERFVFARRLAAGDAMGMAGSFDELLHLEQRSLVANASWLSQLTLERLGRSRSGRQVVNDVSAAVRSSRSRRRDLLGELDGDALAESAPLWLGTVGDIDDVLPAKAAMFDLVILDEASQMDQIASAGALLRANRAVVCGDPRQLRHVSFVSDAAVDDANRARTSNGLGRIDLRRQSILDQAVAAGTARALRTHYRSSPHLISFSASKFYNGGLDIATTNPTNDGTDLIDVHLVEGSRDENKVNTAQVNAVVRLLNEPRRIAGLAIESIGIVSPFRAQANALVEALVAQFDVDELERRHIEVGTVHAFQGAEFDLVIASWCLGEDDGSRSWAFLNDPNLFNVMVSRARQKLIVVTSVEDPPGLAGDFLRHAHRPPTPQVTPSGEGWQYDVATALGDVGFTIAPNYRVGRFNVDLVLRDQTMPTAVICQPHPDGPEHHLRRDQMLRRLGWRIHDAFESRWAPDVARFAIELRGQFNTEIES